jgi:predicted  nucleic acid-binding Zn-ribbon protein
MSTGVQSLVLGVNSTLDGNEDNLDIKKLEEEFAKGLGTVFAEIKDVQLRSNAEISKMSPEEFFLELDILDKQYEAKIQKILSKQIEVQKKEIILEKKKLEREHEQAKKDAVSLEYDKIEVKKNISTTKSKIEDLKIALAKTEPNSIDYDTIISSISKADEDLQGFESITL